MDEEVRALGARVLYSPVPLSNKVAFIRALRAEIQHGQYDILHCHHDLISALYLLAAAGLPLRRRIVHVHNADEEVLTPNRFKQTLLREPLRRVCLTLADRLVGISHHTLDTFLGGRQRRLGRDVVHYYGIDPARFAAVTADRSAFRQQLNLPEDALILFFGGRLVPEKNPVFAVEVLAALRRLESRAVGVFAGAGSLEQDVLAKARQHKIEAAIRLLGWRNDIPEIMCCCDWFILPHPETPMEGFGIAVVEAQLAGLRMLLTPGIADDPLLPTARFRRLSLAASPAEWAQAAQSLLFDAAPSPAAARSGAFVALTQSPMDMDRALDELLSLHA